MSKTNDALSSNFMDETAIIDTLDTLERRLKRIEFATSGAGTSLAVDETHHHVVDATTRLRKLETRFSALSDSSPSVKALLELCMWSEETGICPDAHERKESRN